MEQRHDYAAAVKAAPEWVRAAEYRVADLESQIKELKAK